MQTIWLSRSQTIDNLASHDQRLKSCYLWRRRYAGSPAHDFRTGGDSPAISASDESLSKDLNAKQAWL